jgi:hypothetical protein
MLNHKRAVALAAIVGLLATAPVAAAKTTHQYSSTVTSAPVSTANGYPAPGGTAVFTGSLTTNAFGAGTVIDHVTITDQPRSNQLTFKGTEVDLFADGSAGNTFTGTVTINDDGSQTVVVDGRFVPGRNRSRNPILFGPGGTGRYHGATGSYRFTGTTPAGSNVTSGTSAGTIAF